MPLRHLILTRAALIALLAALLALAQAAPAAAIGAFGPVQELHRPCKPIDGLMNVDGDLVATSAGTVHGFVSFNGSADCEGSEIWYVERRDGRWTKQLSPYKGTVLAVAIDSTGTYLLHHDSPSVRVTKRTTAGAFTGGRELSGDVTHVTNGDVVATEGTWWAVWAESPVSFPDLSYELFQAKSIGTDVLTKQNITNSPEVSDENPSLVLRPGPRVSMAWTLRDVGGVGRRLGVGTAAADSAWSLRPFELTPARPGVEVSEPSFAFAGGVSHIIWKERRDQEPPAIVTADDRSGWETVKVFNTRGFGPRIAMSSGKVFAAWTTADGPSRAFAAERSTEAGATWTGVTISPSDPADHRVLAVTGTGGKATVLIWDGTRVYGRTQS